MAEHQFIVTVEVNDWDAVDDRTEEDYAVATLNVATLRDARVLDGFGDLSATADVTSVQLL